MGFVDMVGKYLDNFNRLSGVSCFTISNTSSNIDSYYFTPFRSYENIQVGGVVVSNSIEAREFARIADGKVDYIAVDSEKKIESFKYVYPDDLGNIEGETLDIVQQSEVISFKANDLTANAVDIFVSEKVRGVGARKIAIVGLGNIGFKLALKFVERGCWVQMYRRDWEKLAIQAECVNLTKPRGTLAIAKACHTLEECLEDAHVVVAVADTPDIITPDDLERTVANPLLIDCGKACFDNEACAENLVYRTDVTMALVFQLKMIIASKADHHGKFGRRRVNDKTFVCGVRGLERDIILRDINDTDSVIGICDGKGGIVRL
jgi:hypothetical protein